MSEEEQVESPPAPEIRIIVREHDFDIATSFDEPNTLMWLKVAEARILKAILGE